MLLPLASKHLPKSILAPTSASQCPQNFRTWAIEFRICPRYARSAMTTKPNPRVSQIADAISGRGRYGHSPLYWWMWDHFDQLQKERWGRADWKSATEEFVKLGFTNRDKTELKRENVRKTWERVVRDRAKISTDRAPAKAPVASATAPIQAPSQQPRRPTGLGAHQAALPTTDDDDEDPDTFFRTIAKPP